MFLSCSCSFPAHFPFLLTLISRLSCSFQPNSGPTYSRITGTVVACCVCAADRLSTVSSATSTAWSPSDISKHSPFHISTNAPDYWLVQTHNLIQHGCQLYIHLMTRLPPYATLRLYAYDAPAFCCKIVSCCLIDRIKVV